MWYLIGEIFFCLIVAAIVGIIIGWLLKSLFCKSSEKNDLSTEKRELFPEKDSDSVSNSTHREFIKDDLKKIKGIGTVIEKMLNDMGISTYHQIAGFSSEDIERISRELGVFKDRIHWDNWVEQAKELHFRKYGERI